MGFRKSDPVVKRAPKPPKQRHPVLLMAIYDDAEGRLAHFEYNPYGSDQDIISESYDVKEDTPGMFLGRVLQEIVNGMDLRFRDDSEDYMN